VPHPRSRWPLGIFAVHSSFFFIGIRREERGRNRHGTRRELRIDESVQLRDAGGVGRSMRGRELDLWHGDIDQLDDQYDQR
jgi:hypothetical protein